MKHLPPKRSGQSRISAILDRLVSGQGPRSSIVMENIVRRSDSGIVTRNVRFRGSSVASVESLIGRTFRNSNRKILAEIRRKLIDERNAAYKELVATFNARHEFHNGNAGSDFEHQGFQAAYDEARQNVDVAVKRLQEFVNQHGKTAEEIIGDYRRAFEEHLAYYAAYRRQMREEDIKEMQSRVSRALENAFSELQLLQTDK